MIAQLYRLTLLLLVIAEEIERMRHFAAYSQSTTAELVPLFCASQRQALASLTFARVKVTQGEWPASQGGTTKFGVRTCKLLKLNRDPVQSWKWTVGNCNV